MEGNSHALHALLCLAFPPLGVCGCSVSVVVAVTCCLQLPLGKFGRVIEQVGDEFSVKLLGCLCRSAVLKLWFRTALRFKVCDEQHTAFLVAV